MTMQVLGVQALGAKAHVFVPRVPPCYRRAPGLGHALESRIADQECALDAAAPHNRSQLIFTLTVFFMSSLKAVK